VNTSRLLHLVLACVAAAALSSCGQDPSPTDQADHGSEHADDTTSEPTSEPGSDTLALTADGSMAGKCAVPSAEVLAGFDTAFAGTVTSLEDGTATLSVDEWYAGDGDSSTVTVDTPNESLEDLLMAVDFQEGKSYLVSADGDRVTLCGFTAERSPQLQALYDEAFGQ
jgi:hypothetical protein